MRISSGNGTADTAPLQRGAAVDAADGAAEAAGAGAAAAAPLQSAVLQPALESLRAMPEIDHERVAQLRDALAKGELPFDPAKLAGLIQRFHGGES
ncbi:negative regulator of flagellin synthesis FlgM [Janthinobacterium sp. CG_23.3]|uniref:flagellar biosynthesis anti-sigma factor FlgM n=1 Tax=unclassified Janthinobacterium TaxID=2610881 RepID=UPI00034576D8|nr:flagellar biosynthesis anti-sigma factor FlgM [Janthinobacterium sp. CG3]